MDAKTGTAAACPIARCIAVVGEKWALLIVRDALAGLTRFADFRTSLGIAPDVLTDRLGKLVGHGILQRRSYRDPGERARDEYVLTPAGRDLAPVLAALAGWWSTCRSTPSCPTSSSTATPAHRPGWASWTRTNGRSRRLRWSCSAADQSFPHVSPATVRPRDRLRRRQPSVASSRVHSTGSTKESS